MNFAKFLGIHFFIEHLWCLLLNMLLLANILTFFLNFLCRFRANLREISNKIKERNSSIKEPYPYLDPDEVPNAISI